MNWFVWSLKARRSRRRLNRLHRLVAGTLYTSWTSQCGIPPDDSLLGWTSGLTADLSWVLDQQQNEDGTRYAEVYVDRLAHQIGTEPLTVVEMTLELNRRLHQAYPSDRMEPYFELLITSKNTLRSPLKVIAATRQPMPSPAA